MGKARKIAALMLATATAVISTVALAGEPTGGASSIVCDENGVCVEHQTVQCKRNAFAWGQECWSRGEGKQFVTWLREHGSSPARFKKNHPQLAAKFKQPWPGENWERINSDFHRSLSYASEAFGVSFHWLHDCGHSEGSDRMVWNGGIVDPNLTYYPRPSNSSGAYGPMQFMEGTFYWMANAAWKELRVKIPAEYRRWNSNLGQALAAAWGFRNGHSSHWTGANC